MRIAPTTQRDPGLGVCFEKEDGVQGFGEWAMDHWAAGSRRGAEGLRQRARERKVEDESVPCEESARLYVAGQWACGVLVAAMRTDC